MCMWAGLSRERTQLQPVSPRPRRMTSPWENENDRASTSLGSSARPWKSAGSENEDAFGLGETYWFSGSRIFRTSKRGGPGNPVRR